LRGLLATPFGAAWWRTARQTIFPPEFVSDVDALLAKT
jgi:hypothetical protein